MGLLVDRIRETFRYDAQTGKLFWTRSPRAGFVGREAGGLKDGYLEVRCAFGKFRVHRLIWMFVTGAEIPAGMLIDHVNGNRADNRWSNLRLATRSQNNHNRHVARRDSVTGVRGVKFRAERNRYVPVLKVDGRERKFGAFRTIEEAAERFKAVELEYRGENASCLF